MRRKLSLVALLALCGFSAMPARLLRAQQWNLIVTLPYSVSAIYFLDHFSAPNTGFAGTTGGIYQTTDGGISWHACANTGGLSIRDFTFKDAMTGWAVASNVPIVAATTDGGATWVQLPAPNAGTTIRYAANTNTLFMTHPMASAQQSTDGGATWTPSAVDGLNGLSFADGASGIWSSHGNFPIFWTSDGGLNWSASNLTHHIYSPTPLGSSPTMSDHSFFGASEYDDSCYLSIDGGNHWTYRGLFTAPAMTYSGTTGCVQYSSGFLWTQTTGYGMFLSRDTGISWISLCGPSMSIDSRFYARGRTIFAASFDQLYEDPDGTIVPPPASIACNPDSLALLVPHCGSTRLLVDFSPVGGCYVELDSVYLTGRNNFSVTNLILPDPLGSLEAGIDYRDGGQQFDTGYLHLVWRSGGILRDTILPVHGQVGGPPATLALPSLSKLQTTTCTPFDTSIQIESIACDTLILLDVHLTDSSFFRLSPLSLPLELQPNTSLGLGIGARFLHPGTYRDTLRIRIQSGTAHTIKDTTIFIAVQVAGVAPPIAGNLTVRATNGCQAIDTVIHIENIHCALGSLDSAIVSDPKVTLITDTAFPMLLPPDSSVPIHIHIQPEKSGTALAAITLYFDIDSVRIDTVIFVTVITSTTPEPSPVFSPSKIAFGPSSLCWSKQAAFVYRNVQCDTMLLQSIRWSYPDTEFSFDSVNLPATLAPGEADTIFFHYRPAAARGATATMTLTFELDGYTKEIILGITGNGTDAATAAITPDTLAFPSITKCDARTDSAMFVNTSCDTLVITSAQDWSPGGFIILSPALPLTIAPGDSIPIRLRFAPGVDGTFADSIDLEYHSTASSGSVLFQRLRLFGSAATPFTPAKLTVGDQFNIANFTDIHLSPCNGELDTSFTIQNLNPCDSISIDSIVADQTGFTIDATPPLPVTLSEDSSVTIHFHFVPARDTEQARLHLIGNNLDTLVPIEIFRARADSLSFTPMSTWISNQPPPFLTRPCHAVSQTFVLSGGGCDSVDIDSLLLSSGSTKFILKGAPTTPFALNGSDTLTATYDPTRAGLDSTELIVTSAGAAPRLDLHIPLVGFISNPTPVAKCGIVIDAKARDTVQAGGTATLALRALDAVPDSLGLTDISFDLTFNDDLLTKLRINPSPGFTIGTTSSSIGSLALQFIHTTHTPIAAGDPIGSVDFYATIGDTLSTPIALRDLRFNASDSTYEECTLSSLAAPDTVYLTLAPECGTPQLAENLRGNLLVFGIQPTVVTHGTQIKIDLSLKTASTISVRLFTTNGEEIARISKPLIAGRQMFPFELVRIPHGAAFLEISDGTEKYVRKVVFE